MLYCMLQVINNVSQKLLNNCSLNKIKYFGFTIKCATKSLPQSFRFHRRQKIMSKRTSAKKKIQTLGTQQNLPHTPLESISNKCRFNLIDFNFVCLLGRLKKSALYTKTLGGALYCKSTEQRVQGVSKYSYFQLFLILLNHGGQKLCHLI